MAQQPGNELVPNIRQVVLVVFVEEGVVFAAKERLVYVHPGAVDAGDGLGHEGGVGSADLRQFLHHQPRRHHAVGHGQRVGVLQVNLVLAGGGLVMGILYRNVHLGQVQHGVAAQVAGRLAGKLVEVAAAVQRLRFVGAFEVEVFQLGADVVGVAHAGQALQVALQHRPRVAIEGVAARTLDVAEHTGHGVLLGTPGQEGEGVGVGKGAHIALVGAGVALDGGAVEADAFFHGVAQVGGIDGESLEVAENIGEPETHELDVGILGSLQNIVLGCRVLGCRVMFVRVAIIVSSILILPRPF